MVCMNKEKADRFIYLIEHAIRPLLTLVIVLLFAFTAVICVILHMITGNEYFNAMSSPTMLILGFWFGERAQKRQIQYAAGVGTDQDQNAP